MDKFWMIVNVANAQEDKWGRKVSEKDAPKFIHDNEDDATRELFRLQDRNPHCEFVLLEAMAKAKLKTVLVLEPCEPGVPF